MSEPLPLEGVRVLDLSTLVPGPLTSLLLAEAGAEVVKIERPGAGDEMRSYTPKLGHASANYAILNRGKRAFAADLKDPEQRDRVLELAATADVVLEQFRPGVMKRLGLGYDDVRAVNPRVVYCSITGYGQDGPWAAKAGHDLTYLAESGLLGTVVDGEGAPALPPSVLADITGGTYPAALNILLALRRAERTGEGCHVQVSLAHNVQFFGYGYLATHQAGGGWPRPGAEMLTGGSPRYQLYRTADARYVACAPLEQKFWDRLTELVGLDEPLRDDTGQEAAVIAALSGIFATEPAAHWAALFEGEDVCAAVVATWDEAVLAGLVEVASADVVVDPEDPSQRFSTLVTPVDPSLRAAAGARPYPALVPLPSTSVWERRS